MAREEDEQRNCALTSEDCKGFFRRTVSKSTGLTCPFAGSWKVNKAQERCSLLVSTVLSHPFPRHNDPIGRSPGVAVSKTGPAAGTASIDAAEEKELVQTLLGAQTRHVGTMFDQFVQFRVTSSSSVHPSPALSTQFPVLPLLTHFADINTFMVEQIIRLTKDLPLSVCFLLWPMEDQISLLKEAAEPGVCVHGCHGPLLSWEASLKAQKLLFHHLCPNAQLPESIHPGLLVFKPVEWVYPSLGSPGHHAGHPQPPTLSFPTPYLTDRPGITQREGTDQLQEEIALTLQSYIKGQQQNPRDRFLYAKLLGRLADLRSINNACWYQIENIQGTVHHGATAPGDLQLRPSSPPSPDHLDMLDWKGENARTRGWSQ
uniref:Nuclear receptor domain-containing protein n=1 Tax=Monodon monoceros TaxID=40151 RepID=A0A8C6AVQ4_MONMO